jgi:O-antigen/teichoic acid export membrane protein
MGRMLGPSDYGILAVLTSMLYIFGVPTTAIQTLAARHTTRLGIKEEYGKIKGMMKFMIKDSLVLSTFLFLIFLVLALFFSNDLGISFWLLAITGLYLFGAFLSPIGIGILQGMKKFSAWGFNTIINSLIKVILAIILVIAGFQVYGPMLGFFFGIMISFILIFPFIKVIMNSKEVKEEISLISKENLSLIGAILIITLMYSMDIIFAKLFFTSEIAGKYSVASMIGKMIFFATASISGAMFPISSERFFKNSKEVNSSLIKKTFFFITVICLIAIISLLVFPKLIISILFGKAYLSVYSIMLYIGVAYSFLSLTNTLILYKLSVSKFRIRHALLLTLFLIIEIIAFIFFKNSLISFAFAFMVSTIITFFGSLLLIKNKT